MRCPVLRGSPIPWLFVAFFAVVFLANGVMIAVAFQSWTGLETDNAYLKGLAYNQALDARAQESNLAWRVAASLDRTGPEEAELRVRIRGRRGEAIYPDNVEAEFVRPTLVGHDFTVSLEKDDRGHYAQTLSLPLSGLWDVRISVTKGSDVHHSSRRFVVRP